MADAPSKTYQSGELSPDHQHYWDGQQWMAAVSPDGQYRWDGAAWVSNSVRQTPPPMPTSPSRKPGFPRWLIVLGFIVFLPITGLIWMWRRTWTPKVKWGLTAVWVVVWGIAFAANGASSSSTRSASAAQTPASASTQSAATSTPKPSTPTPVPTPTPTPKPQFATFHDGILKVGAQVQPGTYRTRSGSSGCYFARLKGFSGSVDDILANGTTSGPAVVTIASTDAGFQSARCATWTADLSAITKSQTSFGEGTFIVGTDMQPGTYKNSGGTGCYYARLRGFSNSVDDILANNNTDAPAIVTIDAGDKGFMSVRCGTWTKT